MGEVGCDELCPRICPSAKRLRNAGHLFAVLLEVREVAKNEHLRQAGRIEVAVTMTQPRLSVGAPSILPRGEACTPAAQRITAASIR